MSSRDQAFEPLRSSNLHPIAAVPPEEHHPTTVVIVPATDGPATLASCVRAIEAADDPPDELIVIDSPPARGPAAARNEGAARATADILIFVDADVLPHPDAFGRIRNAFEADERLAAVFGSYDDAPADKSVVSSFRNLLHHHVHQQGAGRATTFWAGLGAVRRSTFERVGGFDSDRFADASVEDVEFGMRLAASGEIVQLDPAIRGTHLKRWTFLEMLRVDASRRAFPWARLLLVSERSATLNLGWRHRLSALTCVGGVTAVFLRSPRAALAALVTLVALNASFYSLLLRRRGAIAAVVGIGLHVAHHLAGVAGAAAALAAHLAERRRKD